MGCRGQVYIKDSGVYLYTHWGAEGLVNRVKAALSKKWRWDDGGYLARIIFDEMTNENHGNETGFGIDCCEHGDIETLVTVDCKNKKISFWGHYGEDGWIEKKNTITKTFDEFINR